VTSELALSGCRATPLSGYLSALGAIVPSIGCSTVEPKVIGSEASTSCDAGSAQMRNWRRRSMLFSNRNRLSHHGIQGQDSQRAELVLLPIKMCSGSATVPTRGSIRCDSPSLPVTGLWPSVDDEVSILGTRSLSRR
jgi:hypothetical protein